MENSKKVYEAPDIEVLKLYSEDVMLSAQDYVSSTVDDGIHLPPMPLD